MKKNKIIFHIDINNTITMCDITAGYAFNTEDKIEDNKKISYIINEIMTKCIYINKTENEKERMFDKIKRENKNFKEVIEKIHETEYKDDKEFQEDRKKMLLSTKNKIFESFLYFLDNHPNERIIFRTFGKDGEHVIEELIKMGYERFKNTKFGKMRSKLVDGKRVDKLIIEDKEYDPFEYISNNECSLLIKDHYPFWNDNDKKKEFGKILKSLGNKCYFLDDLDCVHYDKEDKNCNVPRINTVHAATRKNYFMDLLYNQ